jgi:hypothetical protein
VAAELGVVVADPARRAALAAAQTSADVLDVLGRRARAVQVHPSGLGTVTGRTGGAAGPVAVTGRPTVRSGEAGAPRRERRPWWRRWLGLD